MKILILANNDVGLYKFRRELLEELLKRNEVFISLPYGSFVDDMINMGCNFIDTKISRHGKNFIQDLKLLKFYKQLLRKIHPDIVLTYTIKPNIYGGLACSKMNVPYISNITGLGTAVENPGLLQKITLFLYKKALKKAKMVFFQNKENQEFMLARKVINRHFDLLPGSGVNLDRYRVSEYPKSNIINFVFIARVMKEKGIDQYLEAAKYFTEKYDNVRFHICGAYEQDYKDILDEYINKGIVIYHGLVKNMQEIYEMESCTIHPTYYPEGLSNVLLESCASARPIITTNRSGCREVVDDGLNGYVVEQKNTKDLIEKIEKFILLSYEEKKNMGLNGRKKVEKEFDRKIVINKYLDIINDLCKGV